MSTDPLREALEQIDAGSQKIPGNPLASTGLSDMVTWQEVRDWITTLPAPDSTTEWGVRRDADSAVYSREQAEGTIQIQRKLHSVLIRCEVGPWEVAL